MPVTSAKPISVTTMSTVERWVSILNDRRLDGESELTIVLSLVDMCAHGNDAGDTGRVGLRGTGGRGVHDRVLGVAEEVGGSTETVKHTAAHHASAVGVGVDVDLNGGVHADNSQSLDNLGGVRDGLWAEEELRRVTLVVVVEALKTVGAESNGGRGSEVEVAAVEQVEEAVLKHLGPDLEVLEVGTARGQATNNGVGNVADTGLNGSEVRRETTVLYLMQKELDQVAGDLTARLVLGSVGLSLVHVVGLNNGNDLLRVDRNVRKTNAVLRGHDQVRLLVRRNVGTDNVVKASEIRRSSVDLDDDLLGHLDDFGRSSNGSTRDYATLGSDSSSLNDSNIELLAGVVLGVVSIDQIRRTHRKVLVEELDVAVVDSLCDVLADLVGASPLDHVVARPSVLGLGAGRGTNEEVVLELSLQTVLLDMVGQCGGCLLGVADASETTPAL
jgi:hypothetical protein